MVSPTPSRPHGRRSRRDGTKVHRECAEGGGASGAGPGGPVAADAPGRPSVRLVRPAASQLPVPSAQRSGKAHRPDSPHARPSSQSPPGAASRRPPTGSALRRCGARRPRRPGPEDSRRPSVDQAVHALAFAWFPMSCGSCMSWEDPPRRPFRRAVGAAARAAVPQPARQQPKLRVAVCDPAPDVTDPALVRGRERGPMMGGSGGVWGVFGWGSPWRGVIRGAWGCPWCRRRGPRTGLGT